MDKYQKRVISIITVFVLFLVAFLLSGCVANTEGWANGRPPAPPALQAIPTRAAPHMVIKGRITIDDASVPINSHLYSSCGQAMFSPGETRTGMRDGESVYGIIIWTDNPSTTEVDGCVDGDIVAFGLGSENGPADITEVVVFEDGGEAVLDLTGSYKPAQNDLWKPADIFDPTDA